MKQLSFPQVSQVPYEVKQKVMEHVNSSLSHSSHGLERAKLVKILAPMFIFTFFLVGILSFVILQRKSSQQLSSLSPSEVQLLEQRLGEADQILADLQTI